MNAKVLKALAFALAVSLLAGCGAQKKGQDSQTAADVETVNETKLPIVDKPTKFTLWCNNSASRVLTNYGEQKAWKEVQKRTGVELEFIHPTGAASEQFNIMMASGDYPDIINYSWGSTLSKYVDKKVALVLNPYLGIMPNLRKLIETNETVAKQIKLADGTIANFPQINSLTDFNYWDGYFVRQDWLDAVNEQPPETIDDWYRVLTAFKGKDLNGNGVDDEIPFTAGKIMMPTAFIGAFGVLDDFYINPETGKVSYGALDAGFKEYVTTMHKWYSEGLIDGEYLNVDQKLQDEKILNNLVGACYIDNNNSMINYLNHKPVPEFDLTPVPMPSVKNGKRYYSRGGVKDLVAGGGGIITSSCSDPITAIKLLDYLYSDEATVLFNWGIENESYTVENGEYKYTDEILHNPDGKTPYDAIAKYCINYGFMKIYDIKAIRGLDAALPAQIKERKLVSDEYAKETDKTLVLPSMSLTAEELNECSKIKSELKTHVDEMKAKFIMGKESLDSYDAFVENLKKMKAERAVEIMQTAYDRYLKS